MENENYYTYEEAIAALEKIVGDIENPERPLSQIVSDVEKATKLIDYCNKIIKDTKEQIEKYDIR